MAQVWDSIVDQLWSFPGDSISLRTASTWDEAQGEGLLTISFFTGSVYESCKLHVLIVVGGQHTEIVLQDSNETDHPEGVVEATTAASHAVTSSGPESVRSAILRLCDELCIELDAKESGALKVLGRSTVPCATSTGAAVPSPPTLRKEISVATSHSFESDDFSIADGYRESSSSLEGLAQVTKPAPNASRTMEWAPTVEDVVAWSGAVDGLKKIPGQLLDLHSAGSWDGKEGLIEIELHSRDDSFDWQHLRIVLIAGAKQTSIELKGAQAIPEAVRHAVRGANDACAWGTGPSSVGAALIELCAALCVELQEIELNALKVLGDRAALVKHLLQSRGDGASVGPENLFFEMKAVEALKTQLGLIGYQIQHVQTRMKGGLFPQLQHELDRLKYSEGEVSAEMGAAAAAVEAALLQSTETSGITKMIVKLRIEERPSQSLRGHGVKSAETKIRNALSSSGPWAHYAAHQFSTMLSREQDLDGEFICLYHSYSLSAIMYEVQAVIARQIYGLSSDLPPVPRLSTVESGICRTLAALKGLGGKDANPNFQALGLSSSCSIFASGSEAPPLTCFQGHCPGSTGGCKQEWSWQFCEWGPTNWLYVANFHTQVSLRELCISFKALWGGTSRHYPRLPRAHWQENCRRTSAHLVRPCCILGHLEGETLPLLRPAIAKLYGR